MVDKDKLQARLEAALRRLLELGGVEIGKPWAGHNEAGWNYLDPMEPMLYAPPSFWLSSTSQHLYEIVVNCNSIIDDLSALISAASEGKELPEDSLLIFSGSVEDLEFHLFTSHLHTYLIRDALLFRATAVHPDILKPSFTKVPDYIQSANTDPLTREIVTRLRMSEKAACEMVESLVTLMRHCRFTHAAVERLGSDPDAELDALGHRFADVQFACASLAAEMVQADLHTRTLSELAVYGESE